MTGIPGYTLLRELGRGGMATVHLAIQESLGREVALKRLAPTGGDADGVAAERFLREARIAASLHHPNILPIHDFGVHEGVPYLAMEYEAGGTIAPMTGEKLAPREALRLVRDVASALDYAHARGVVHRDIKPDNILRRADGGAMLSDFGIARLMQGDSVLTTEGTSVGTPHYMSPEQLRGEKVDGRSDLYGLGVVLWQLLTGELPYSGTDAWSIGTQHLAADIPRLPPALGHLQPLLDSLLAKSPDARVQSGAELVARIDGLLAATPSPATTPVHGVHVAAPSLAARGRRRNLAVAALLAAIVIGTLAWFAWKGAQVPATRADAAPVAAAAAPAPAKHESIAVLAFEDLSVGKDQGYFSDGVAEELQERLAQVPGLQVAGRASSRSFKGKSATVAEIGKALGVGHVLEGSVRKAGESMRVSVQLSDARTGFQLWSQSYDRQLDDVFAVQDEIAVAVVEALKLRLLAPAEGRGARHVPGFEAYDNYLLGRQNMVIGDRASFELALAAYRKAVALDPEYAEAWSGLAMAETFRSQRDEDGEAAMKLARAAAERAIALDPTLGDAYASRAYIRGNDWNWNGALEDAAKAVSLAPRDGRNQMRHAFVLSTLGRQAEARAALEAGARADPLLLPVWHRLALTALAQRDYAGVRHAAARARAIDPASPFSANLESFADLLEGNARAARARFAAGKNEYGVLMADYSLGRRKEAGEALSRLIAAEQGPWSYGVAMACAWTGQADCAFEQLDRIVAARHVSALSIPYDPLLETLRGDPRYAALLARMGLPPAKT
jgi:TolB-like protein/tetratricopeptide (TPR) repeat protein